MNFLIPILQFQYFSPFSKIHWLLPGRFQPVLARHQIERSRKGNNFFRDLSWRSSYERSTRTQYKHKKDGQPLRIIEDRRWLKILSAPGVAGPIFSYVKYIPGRCDLDLPFKPEAWLKLNLQNCACRWSGQFHLGESWHYTCGGVEENSSYFFLHLLKDFALFFIVNLNLLISIETLKVWCFQR